VALLRPLKRKFDCDKAKFMKAKNSLTRATKKLLRPFLGRVQSRETFLEEERMFYFNCVLLNLSNANCRAHRFHTSSFVIVVVVVVTPS
jgi:hypothetical protein